MRWKLTHIRYIDKEIRRKTNIQINNLTEAIKMPLSAYFISNISNSSHHAYFAIFCVVCLFLVSILVQGIKKFRFSQISIKSAAHISLKLISFQLKLSINIFQNVIDCWMHAIDGFQTILSHLTKFRIFILILNSLRKIKMNHATRLCVRCLQGI